MQIASLISPPPASKGSGGADPASATDSDETSGFVAVLSRALASLRGQQPADSSGEEADGEPTDVDHVGEGDPRSEDLIEDTTGTVLLATGEVGDPADSTDVMVATPEQPVDDVEHHSTESEEVAPVELTLEDATTEEAPEMEGVIGEDGPAAMATGNDVEPERAGEDGSAAVASGNDVEPEHAHEPVEAAVPVAVDDVERVELAVDDVERAEADELVEAGDEAEPLPTDGVAFGLAVTPTETATVVPDTDTEAIPVRAGARVVADNPMAAPPVLDAESAPVARETSSVASAMFEAELEALEADDPWQQVARVVRPLRQLADGSHRIALQLRPAELGSVHIEVALEDGRLSMRAVTDTVAARDALVAALPELRGELTRSGIDLGSLDVGEETASGDSQAGQSGRGESADQADTDGSAPVRSGSSDDANPTDQHRGAIPGRLDLTL